MPPNDGPGSFSTMKHVMPSDVRAASVTKPARSPLVTHVLVPSSTYSSPSGVALQRSDRVSLPASGSDRDRQPRNSPVAMRDSHRSFCAAVPWSAIRVAVMEWVLRMPVRDIQPKAISSTMRP